MIYVFIFFVFRGQRLLYSLSRLSPLWTLKWFSLGTKMDDCLCLPSPAAISATQRSEYHLCSIRFVSFIFSFSGETHRELTLVLPFR